MWDNNQIDPRECFIRKEEKSLDLDKNSQSINIDTIKRRKLSNIIENKTGINEKETNELIILEEKVIILIKEIIELINFSEEQKKIILLKSLNVLNTFISRAEDKEFIIRKDTKPATIASSIIYAVILSNKNMPEINLTAISKLTKINVGTINSFYNNHFRYLYPKIEFSLNFSKKLRKIKDIFALYFFEILKDLNNNSIKQIEYTILNYLSTLKKNILRGINLPKQLSKGNVKLLCEIIDIYADIFDKYFSDLAKIVNYIIIQSNILNKIGAHFIVQPFCDFIIKENINLLYKPSTLGRYIIPEIYDYLREFYPNFFPIRVFQRKIIPKNELKRMKNEYRLNIGNKIKLYVIKHIYNGLYFKHGKGQCPKCLEEEFTINTDITRLSSLEFHHKSKKKERSFTAPELGRMFENSGFNPNFLEDLIKLIESEKVILLCRNHHKIIHNKYYRYFR